MEPESEKTMMKSSAVCGDDNSVDFDDREWIVFLDAAIDQSEKIAIRTFIGQIQQLSPMFSKMTLVDDFVPIDSMAALNVALSSIDPDNVCLIFYVIAQHQPDAKDRLDSWVRSTRGQTSSQTLLICTILRCLRDNDTQIIRNVVHGIEKKLTNTERYDIPRRTFDKPVECSVILHSSIDTSITRDNLCKFVTAFNDEFESNLVLTLRENAFDHSFTNSSDLSTALNALQNPQFVLVVAAEADIDEQCEALCTVFTTARESVILTRVCDIVDIEAVVNGALSMKSYMRFHVTIALYPDDISDEIGPPAVVGHRCWVALPVPLHNKIDLQIVRDFLIQLEASDPRVSNMPSPSIVFDKGYRYMTNLYNFIGMVDEHNSALILVEKKPRNYGRLNRGAMKVTAVLVSGVNHDVTIVSHLNIEDPTSCGDAIPEDWLAYLRFVRQFDDEHKEKWRLASESRVHLSPPPPAAPVVLKPGGPNSYVPPHMRQSTVVDDAENKEESVENSNHDVVQPTAPNYLPTWSEEKPIEESLNAVQLQDE